MKRFSEQLKKKADSIHLRAVERHDLRERLVSYMEYHPLTADSAKMPMTETSMISEPFFTFRIDFFLASRLAGVLTVLFLIIVPIVAEKAVPGDILYPIKVSFNEEVRSTLTLSPYQKVEWETERLERRIAEARLLADAGLLTPEVEAEVAEAVKHHSEAAQQEIATLSESNNEEAAIAQVALSSALEVQSEILESQSATTTNGEPASTLLADAVERAMANTDPGITGEPLATETLLAFIETETTRAFEYLDSVNAVATKSEQDDIRRRLEDIRTKIKLALNETDKTVASNLLLTTLSDTRKLISFMTNIDVRANLSVEDLVPLVLTGEERTSLLEANLEDIVILKEQINLRLPNVPEDILAKVNPGLVTASTFHNTATTSLAAKDFDSAEVAVKEAWLILNDLDLLTIAYKGVEIEEAGNATSTETTAENATNTPETTEARKPNPRTEVQDETISNTDII